MKARSASYLFWVGLLIRLMCLPFLGSSLFHDLFIPFIDSAILQPTANPWLNHPPQFFPYGTFLFALLATPKWLGYLVFGSSALGAAPLSVALMKLPVLAMDYVFLRVLSGAAPHRRQSILWLYWLNPVLIYISYVYGQMDVIPMCLLMLSLVFVMKDRWIASSILFAAATLSKFHVVIVLPLVLAYIWNRHFLRPAIQRVAGWTALWAVLAGVGFLPLYWAGHFGYASTNSPEALRLFAFQIQFDTGAPLFIGLIGVLAIVVRLMLSSRISDRGLVFGCGIVFGSLLLVTNPYPSWYFWVLPFLALFFALQANAPVSLFFIFLVQYFGYFVILPLWNLDQYSTLVSGIAFSLLQLSLAVMNVFLWILGVRKEADLSRRSTPVALGIAGDSGAGKNRLARVCAMLFNPNNTVVMEGDDYHRWERGNEKWSEYTHLSPRANYLDQMFSHAGSLVHGLAVVKSSYDHSTGRFTAPQEVRPSKTVIVQGLHTFYLRGLRNIFDLSIFLDPEELVRVYWKSQRDIKERGASLQKVLSSVEGRRPDAIKHIHPQKSFADLIVRFVPEDAYSLKDVEEGVQPKLALQVIGWNDMRLDWLAEHLSHLPNSTARVQVAPSEDFNRLSVVFTGMFSSEEIAKAAQELFPDLRRLTRARVAPTWASGFDGVIQLVILAALESRFAFAGRT